MLHVFVALIIFAAPVTLVEAQSRPVDLISIYKKNTLFDISPDGNLLLLYGASAPKKETKNNSVIEWKPKRGEDHFDMLRVVEWASGREVASIHVHDVPGAAHFTADGKQVCYQAQKEEKSWDYVSGQMSICTVDSEQSAYPGSGEKYVSPDGKFIAETSRENVRQVLLWTYVRGVVTIADRSTGEKFTVPHPTVREPLDWPLTGYVYSVSLTPDNQHVITSYESDTYVWRIKS